MKLNGSDSLPNSQKRSKKEIFLSVLKYTEIILGTAIVSVGITVFILKQIYVPKAKYDSVIRQLNRIHNNTVEARNNSDKEVKKNTDNIDSKLRIASIDASIYSKVTKSEYSYYAPEPGNIFMIFFVEIENTSSYPHSFSISDFEVYQDNIKTKFTFFSFSTMISGSSPLIVSNFDVIEIKPGRKQSGYLAVEIPEASEKIEFIYAEDDGYIFTR